MAADAPALKKALIGIAGFVGTIVIVAIVMKVKPELFPANFRRIFPWAAALLVGLVLVSALGAYFSNRRQ
jgi:multisubunit Na+/H+ antiporter MnhB subunit